MGAPEERTGLREMGGDSRDLGRWEVTKQPESTAWTIAEIYWQLIFPQRSLDWQIPSQEDRRGWILVNHPYFPRAFLWGSNCLGHVWLDLAEEQSEDRARESESSKRERGKLEELLVVTSWSANILGTKEGILVTQIVRARRKLGPTWPAAQWAPGVWPDADSPKSTGYWLPDFPIAGHCQAWFIGN